MKRIIKLFEQGNCCVCGLRGSGKDMLMANVVVRRKKPYISNVAYGGSHHDFIPMEFDCGRNTYANFLHRKVMAYKFGYRDETDIYISDAGIYFPSQYCGELNKQYGYFATFMALSRQLGECNVHFNAQNLNRVWDKIREQSDIYIMSKWCKVFFHKLVIQRVYIYESYDSAVKRVPLFSMKRPLLNPNRQLTYDLAKQNYYITHGKIKAYTLIYFNRSNYNTRIFKEVLENGKTEN